MVNLAVNAFSAIFIRIITGQQEKLRSLATSADPCDPCADELELNEPVGNYLFRVEVHDVTYDSDDQPEALVLKWSSENGAEAYATANVPPDFAARVAELFGDDEAAAVIGSANLTGGLVSNVEAAADSGRYMVLVSERTL